MAIASTDPIGGIPDQPHPRAVTPEQVAPGSPAMTVAPAPAPAGQVFAAALHRAAAGEERRPRAASAAPAIIGPAAPDVARAPDAPAAPAIDLTDHRWPARMLERIEALRDDADAASTRVRFAPDALGPVEVRVRHDGGAVHLHFTAAQAETRALLQAAQPDLARLAGERGVRLGQSSVGGGDAQPQRQPPAPARFAAPPRATPDPGDADPDIRIA